MTQTPQLSIIMACFNRKDMVRIMVDSIKANDFADWELIIVDDGSDEDTLLMLDSFTGDSRVKVLYRPAEMPKGAQSCRNMGLDLACGQYVVFFDSDDYITPYCLSTRVRFMDEHPDLDFMVFPSVLYIDEKMVLSNDSRIFGFKVFDDDLAQFASRVLPFVVVNNIYRLDSLRRHGIRWDTNLRSLQDADFNMLALVAGLKYDYAQAAPDYGYRINHSAPSISQQIIKKDSFPNHTYALRKFYQNIQQAYGDKYNAALFDGFLRMFIMLSQGAVSRKKYLKLIDDLTEFDRRRYRIFKFVFACSSLIEPLLSLQMIIKIILRPYELRLRQVFKLKNERLETHLAMYSSTFAVN